MTPKFNYQFPKQKVPYSTKQKADWYQNCIDYIVDLGISMNDRDDTLKKLDILHGNIPQDFYRKTLNPYNASNEMYTNFPATMRNYDIMNDIIRRYVSEYQKGVHDFIAGADSPAIVANKNAKLKQAIMAMAQQAFEQELQRNLQQLQQQAQQSGQDSSQIDPQQAMPDPEQFVKDFQDKYISDESKQAQDVLDFVRSITDDTVVYLKCFFDFVALGECYSYSDVRGSNFVKSYISVDEAYPIPNNKQFIEDHDMFARRFLLSYAQISDMFGDLLTENDKKLLDDYHYKTHSNAKTIRLSFDDYQRLNYQGCDKFTEEERNLYKREPVIIHNENSNLFEVWHVVWKGMAQRGIVTYVNQIGMLDTKIVEEGYRLNKELGDIEVEWIYEEQVYEGYRIGTRYNGIYPIKARPIAYQRKGKLPYNGIMEILPGMGKFSIISLVTPYQIMRNIIAYHREMVIAKNKQFILVLPKSLVGGQTGEDAVYRMAADGVLPYDDSEDTNSLKAQQIRMLNANMGQYITELTNLNEALKQEARELVDMNSQRYGDIAQSAGVGTTQEAIARSSMGMVIIVTMFDEFRKRDYNRDLDFAKLAYVDGLQTSFYDDKQNRRTISLDVDSFISSDLSTIVRNEAKELDKLNQLRQWAFSAAQNGDLDMAIAAITGDNVAKIKEAVEKFSEIKRQHESDMQQQEQMLEQAKHQYALEEIQAKGDQDVRVALVKAQASLEAAMMTPTGNPEADAAAQEQNSIARQKAENDRSLKERELQLKQQEVMANAYGAAADRAVKMHEIDTNLKIAKTNKNKYDK